MNKMGVCLNTFGMEMDKMEMKQKWTALFQTIWNGNGLHYFKPFRMEMSNTVHHFFELAIYAILTIQNGQNGLKCAFLTGTL